MVVIIPEAKMRIFDFYEGDGDKRVGMVELLSTLCPDEEDTDVREVYVAFKSMLRVGELVEYRNPNRPGLYLYGLPRRIGE